MPNHSPALDGVFRALSDGTRRGMIERLGRGPASVGELAAPLRMSLPSVLQHLAVLEESGLVRTEKVGRVRTCTLVPAALGAAERWFEQRRAAWEKSLDRLGDLLAAEDPHPEPPKKRSKR